MHPTSDIAPRAWQLPEKTGDVKSLPCTPDPSGLPESKFSVVLTVFVVGMTPGIKLRSPEGSVATEDLVSCNVRVGLPSVSPLKLAVAIAALDEVDAS